MINAISFHDGNEFQAFCNSLLFLELGDGFDGNEAPGKDEGVDGEFDGLYQRKTGKWRFQYKFHGTARKVAFASLKRDVADEIKKIKNEKYLRILTNVPLNPAEKKEIKALASKKLMECDCDKVEFACWDFSWIKRTYLKYPILKHWLDEKFTASYLLPIDKAFASRLKALPTDPYTLSNYFIGRQTEMRQLQDFIQSENEFVTVVGGETGIGKTRLIVEFHQQFITSTNWTTLVISGYQIDLDKLRFALGGNKNYLLIVDDAQNFDPHTLSDIKKLAGYHPGNVIKVIFTIRNMEMNALQYINEFEREGLLKITPGKLSPVETRTIFEKEVTNEYMKNFIDQLVLISRGRPILIVGILNAIAKGQDITTIKTHKGFSDYVLNHFQTFITSFGEKSGLKTIKINRLFSLVCLLEPFNYEDPRIIKKISKSEGIDEYALQSFLSKLKISGISIGRYELSVKPDYYSDIFLKAHFNPGWVKSKFEEYTEHSGNILTNLASIEEIESSISSGPTQLDMLLESYVDSMHLLSSNLLASKLNTIKSITFQKPHIAASAVSSFILAVSNSDFPLHQEISAHWSLSSLQNNKCFRIAKSILHELLYSRQHYDFVFDAIVKLYVITEDKSLFDSTFGFSHPIHVFQHSVQLQKFYVNKVKMFSQKDDKLHLFFMYGLSKLMELSFDTTYWDSIQRESIRWRKHYLPQCQVVEELRMSIIDVLDHYFINEHSSIIKLKALTDILDVPRKTAGSRSKYRNDNETEAILLFIQRNVKNFSAAHKREVLDNFYWYKKQKMPKKFHAFIDQIATQLKTGSCTDRLIEFFNLQETELLGDTETVNGKEDILIQDFSPDDLALALNEIVASGNAPLFFVSFIEHMIKKHIAKSKEVYTKLKAVNCDIIFWLGAEFLRSFRVTAQFEDFFWDEIEWLKEDASDRSRNVILTVYAANSIPVEKLDRRDASLISTLYNYRSTSGNTSLVWALPTLYSLNKEVNGSYLDDFLSSCSQPEVELLFQLLFNYFEGDDFVIKLFLTRTIPFELNFKMEYSLQKASKCLDTDTIFQYFLDRFAYQFNYHDEETRYSYSVVSDSGHSQFIGKLEPAKAHALYKRALHWYKLQQYEWFKDHKAQNLVNYLRPTNEVTEEISSIYISAYSIAKGKPNAVNNLMISLSQFHNKTASLIKLVQFIIDSTTAEDTHAELKYNAGKAITYADGKTGKPEEPFPFDLNLKQLLEKYLLEFNCSDDFEAILRNSLSETNRNIESDTKPVHQEW